MNRRTIDLYDEGRHEHRNRAAPFYLSIGSKYKEKDIKLFLRSHINLKFLSVSSLYLSASRLRLLRVFCEMNTFAPSIPLHNERTQFN